MTKIQCEHCKRFLPSKRFLLAHKINNTECNAKENTENQCGKCKKYIDRVRHILLTNQNKEDE